MPPPPRTPLPSRAVMTAAPRARGPRRSTCAGALVVLLDPEATTALYVQLYAGIRDAILSGRLTPGTRIPSTRALASDLDVSRSTVLLAVGQLTAEGFLTTRSRSGTEVAAALPDSLLTAVRRQRPEQVRQAKPRTVGARGESAAAFQDGFARLGTAPRPFRPGSPALDQFPTELWARLAIRRYRRLSYALLDHADPAGYRPLREAIALHVQVARDVRCTPEQVVITSGAQQALALATQVVLDPGDQAWIEDPGYLSMRGVVSQAGAIAVSVPVDSEGLDVAEGIRRAPEARLAYVTPSHQFPLGITMTWERRRELLGWAEHAGAWIIEDDYDSESRFSGAPLPALQSLDQSGRVLYVGTFSKTVFPSLRIGYLIAAPDLVSTILKARALADGHPSPIEQAILSDFMTEGHFTRHVRRMRALYAERQERLVAEVQQELAGLMTVTASHAGLHLLGWLPRGVSDRDVSAALALRGVEAPALSRYYAAGQCERGALILGYGALDESSLTGGVRAIREVLSVYTNSAANSEGSGEGDLKRARRTSNKRAGKR